MGLRRSLSGIAGSNPDGYFYLVSVVCCQEEVSASGSALIQRIPTECGVSERDRKASTIRRPWPTGECCAVEKKVNVYVNYT